MGRSELEWMLLSFGAGVLLTLGAVILWTRRERQQRRALERQAVTDFLTGLYNRSCFEQTLRREVAASLREGHPTSLLLLDLDDFKRVNDAYGHPAGDEVLRRFGELLRSQCRQSDFPVRYGGEEFAVILPHTGAEGARRAAERLRAALSQGPWTSAHPPLNLTVSIGSATCPADATDVESLVRAADAALYAAKRAGKDGFRAYAEGRNEVMESW